MPPVDDCRYSYFEGGVRASSFLASPLLPASVVGTTNNALLHVADWWPTFAGLAGLNTTDDCGGLHPGGGCPSVDGRDAWAVITGETGKKAHSFSFFSSSSSSSSANNDNARTHADTVPWRTELLLGIGGPKQQGAYVKQHYCGTHTVHCHCHCHDALLVQAVRILFCVIAIEGT